MLLPLSAVMPYLRRHKKNINSNIVSHGTCKNMLYLKTIKLDYLLICMVTNVCWIYYTHTWYIKWFSHRFLICTDGQWADMWRHIKQLSSLPSFWCWLTFYSFFLLLSRITSWDRFRICVVRTAVGKSREKTTTYAHFPHKCHLATNWWWRAKKKCN